MPPHVYSPAVGASRPGLRARKKQRTRLAIADTAMCLFMRDGFDHVTVAAVADAAEVSITTVFNYFPTKEDLFFDRSEAVIDHLSCVVRDRAPHTSVLDACRGEYLDSLRRREWTSGLGEWVRSLHSLIDASPALQGRAVLLTEQATQRLSTTLADDLRRSSTDPEIVVAARTLVGVRTALHAEARRLMLDRTDLDQAAAAMERFAEAAYGTAARGLGDLGDTSAPERVLP